MCTANVFRVNRTSRRGPCFLVDAVRRRTGWPWLLSVITSPSTASHPHPRHYIFHHPPFHLPLRHLYPLVDLWPSHSTAITLHFASGLKQSVAFQLAASRQRLCLDIQDGWESILQFSKWFCDPTSSCDEPHIWAKTKFTTHHRWRIVLNQYQYQNQYQLSIEYWSVLKSFLEFPDSAFPRSSCRPCRIHIFVWNIYKSGFFIAHFSSIGLRNFYLYFHHFMSYIITASMVVLLPYYSN